jgi:hypothetical protein
MTQSNLIARLCISAAAGIGAAIVTTLVIAVMDLYVTGHGYGSIRSEVFTWNSAGVHLSVGDVGMLLAIIAATVSTWFRLGRGASGPTTT